MATVAAAATLYLLLAPMGGHQAANAQKPRMIQLSPAMSQADCMAQMAHMLVPGIRCVPQDSDDAGRVDGNMTSTPSFLIK